TADCSRAAPSAGARSGPNRAPAKSARSTAAGVGSTVGFRASRASRTYGSTPSRPRGRVRGFCARDGTRESASQDECTKTSRLDPEIVRASTVLPPNQGRTESPLLRSGEVFQQTARLCLSLNVRQCPATVEHHVDSAAPGCASFRVAFGSVVQRRLHPNCHFQSFILTKNGA